MTRRSIQRIKWVGLALALLVLLAASPVRSDWGAWEDLGGDLVGGPAVSSWGPNRLDVFVRGLDNQLYHKVWNGSGWSGWEPLGGYLTSDPAAVSWGPGRIDVFARGMDGQLYHAWWDESVGRWSWEFIGGHFAGSPAVSSWGPNRLDVFVRGWDNQVYHKVWDGSGWFWDLPLGGYTTSDPAAVSWEPGRIDVFAGLEGELWRKVLSDSEGTNWEPLGGNIVGGPAVSSWGPNRLDVFVRGLDNQLYHKVWNGSGWSGWEPLGGYLTSDPAAVSWGPGRIDVFARGLNGHLWHIDYQGESIRVLAYNVYMRPTSLFSDGQSTRAALLPEKLRGYDVIIFSELFDDDVRGDLLGRLRPEYPFATRIVGEDEGLEQDGGAIIVSKWPIEAEDQRLFEDANGNEICRGEDCYAEKGVVYVLINKNGRRYHIFGTHTQSEANRESGDVRVQQFQIIKGFIDSLGISANEPVIIGGDLNVDKADTGEYEQMKTILNATHPQQVGHPFTFDPIEAGGINDLASGPERDYLDYVLYSNEHLQPQHSSNEVLIIQADEPWCNGVITFGECLGEWHWDLSDHYPVLGVFGF